MKINICKIIFVYYLISVSSLFASEPETRYNVPLENGRIVDAFNGNDLQNREILIILDAHCNHEAQKNISEILSHYTASFSPVLIGLEGASGSMDISDISRFPIQDVKEHVLNYFMKEGKINGVEYFNILHENSTGTGSDNSIITVGVEDPESYRKNLNAYNAVKSGSTVPAGAVEYLIEQFNQIAEENYSFQQKQFNAMDKARSTKQITYLHYCKYLLELCAEIQVDISSYKTISLVAASLSDEQKIDTFRLEFERKKVARLLAMQDLEDESVQLNHNFKLGKISPLQYYTRLSELCTENNVDLSPYKQINVYMGYLDKINSIDHSKLYSETIVLSEILAKQIFDSSLNWNIYLWDRRLSLLSKLFFLDLSPAEFEFLNTDDNWLDTDKMNDFLSELACEAGLAKEINEKFSQVCASAGTAVDFYRTANIRNEILVNNLLSDMDIEGVKKGALVVGGFHINGISSLLKAGGISYYVVSPNMKTYDHQDLYQSRLKNEMSSFEENIESSISQLADQSTSTITASFLAIASLLADNSLARSGVSQVFRVELKSILTVEGIRAIEQTGLYRLPELKQRIEELLHQQWANKDFTSLDSLRVFRDFDGELIIELKINDVIYTFAGYTSQLFNKINGENPERVLSQFAINGNTVSVILGSEMELNESLLAGNRALDILAKEKLSIDELSERLSISKDILNPILDKWINHGVVVVDSSFHFGLSKAASDVLPVARNFSGRFYAQAKQVTNFNERLKDNFNKFDIREITIDSAVPLSVQVDFFTRLSADMDPALTNRNGLLFTLASDERLYYAQLVDRGEPDAGVRLEFRIIDNTKKPFDKQTRDEKLAAIYDNPAVMDEILNSVDDAVQTAEPVNLNAAKEVSKPLIPVSPEGEYKNILNEKLLSYIDDPAEFDSKNKALIFDLDGTLSARTKYGFEPISDEIIQTLKNFVDLGINVVVISGQPYDEISRRFLDLFDTEERRFLHLYPNNGSAGVGFDENGEKIVYYERSLTEVIPEDEFDQFTNKLHSIVRGLDLKEYETRFGTDQVTFRLPNSSNLERETVFAMMKKFIKRKYPELRIAVAGRYSIDITLNDKSDGVRDFLENRVKVKPENVLFFGDTYQGNDAPLSDGAPDSTHFHVGTLLPGEEIMPNVLKTDGRGVETTEDILLQLNRLINMLVVEKSDPQMVARLITNLNNYYDFSDRFSVPVTDDQLFAIINRDLPLVSEVSGWEQRLPDLPEGNFDENFIGVGATGVNLSYIPAAKPEKTILTESNPWVAMYYVPLRNVLIDIASTRVEFISMLSAKPMETIVRDGIRYYRTIPKITGKHTVEISEHASIDEIHRFFSDIPVQDDYLRELITKVNAFFPEDKRDNLEKFWKLQANKDSFQSLAMLKSMSEADSALGKKSTWMSDEEKYQFLRNYVQQGRVFAVSADWLDVDAHTVSSMLNASGDKVSLVNLAGLIDASSTQVYVDGSDPLSRLIGNIASLPKTENFKVISQHSEQSILEGFAPFNGSGFEYVYSKAVKNRQNKPTNRSIISLNKKEYTAVVVKLLKDIGREDLASFYRDSSQAFRAEILSEFADSVMKTWEDLRFKIRNNEQLLNDEHIKALELASVFGYGLKDMELVINRFENPTDYFMNLFALPFGRQAIFLSRTLADMKAELASTVSYFSREPDIVLVDSSFFTGSANASNIALSKVIDQFKKEHHGTQGRRVLVVAVDSGADGIVTAKNEIDSVLYTRGDSADVFDHVLAFPFDITDPEDFGLYNGIRTAVDESILVEQAKAQLAQQGITDISQEMIEKYIEKMIIEKVKEKKLQSALISRFGMNIETISSRVTVLSGSEGLLVNFASDHGSAIRDIEQPAETAADVNPTGIFLIDILRSIGTQSLPADLSIVGLRTDVTINDEYKQLGFDNYLSLFKQLYTFFEARADEQVTYGSFIDTINSARLDGTLPETQTKLLKSPKRIDNLYRFKTDAILTQKDFVTFFMNILYGDLSVKDKRIVHELSARQLKLYVLTGILSSKQASPDSPVKLGDIYDDLKQANLDIGDVASYLEVDIPARPISGNLNKALNSQRALDTSA